MTPTSRLSRILKFLHPIRPSSSLRDSRAGCKLPKAGGPAYALQKIKSPAGRAGLGKIASWYATFQAPPILAHGFVPHPFIYTAATESTPIRDEAEKIVSANLVIFQSVPQTLS